jgi:hypothetical protein
MKITLCDNCLSNKKLTPTTRYIRVRNRPDLRLDMCQACGIETKLVKLPIVEYTTKAQVIKSLADKFIQSKSR